MSGAVLAATLASGSLIAHLVTAKAARDALFLQAFDVSLLPRMMVAGAVASLVSALAISSAIALYGPARVLLAAVVSSVVLYGAEWALLPRHPEATAVLLYLHVSIYGATLIATLWSLVTERFPQRDAKRAVSRIALGGTLGGAVGGLLSWQRSQHGVRELLLLLMAGTALSAACVLRTAQLAKVPGMRPGPRKRAPRDAASGLQVLASVPYLRQLAILVALGAACTALLDYVLSARAVAAMGQGARLITFFALFHMTVGILGFLVQVTLSRPALSKLGLSGTVATAPFSVLLLGFLGLAPLGPWALVILRGSEAVLRASLYRSAYELLYTPLPRAE